MAVSVDTVYQKVLAIANKEQRGYITPQEFNLFADQVQKEIFEQYFYDVNQFGRQHGNSHEYADMLALLTEKIAALNVREVNLSVTSGILTVPTNTYKLGSVFTTIEDRQVEIEEVNYNEYQTMQLGPLTRPTLKRPVYVNRIDGLNIYPNTIEEVDVSYIKQPNQVQWAYVVVNDKALYNDFESVDFELHSAEESELVYRILALSGIAVKKSELTQAAVQLEGLKVQQEKQ